MMWGRIGAYSLLISAVLLGVACDFGLEAERDPSPLLEAISRMPTPAQLGGYEELPASRSVQPFELGEQQQSDDYTIINFMGNGGLPVDLAGEYAMILYLLSLNGDLAAGETREVGLPPSSSIHAIRWDSIEGGIRIRVRGITPDEEDIDYSDAFTVIELVDDGFGNQDMLLSLALENEVVLGGGELERERFLLHYDASQKAALMLHLPYSAVSEGYPTDYIVGANLAADDGGRMYADRDSEDGKPINLAYSGPSGTVYQLVGDGISRNWYLDASHVLLSWQTESDTCLTFDAFDSIPASIRYDDEFDPDFPNFFIDADSDGSFSDGDEPVMAWIEIDGSQGYSEEDTALGYFYTFEAVLYPGLVYPEHNGYAPCLSVATADPLSPPAGFSLSATYNSVVETLNAKLASGPETVDLSDFPVDAFLADIARCEEMEEF